MFVILATNLFVVGAFIMDKSNFLVSAFLQVEAIEDTFGSLSVKDNS